MRVLLYKSLDCFEVKWGLFVLKCGSFFANRSAVSFPCLQYKYVWLHFTDMCDRMSTTGLSHLKVINAL